MARKTFEPAYQTLTGTQAGLFRFDRRAPRLFYLNRACRFVWPAEERRNGQM
jgi:hypothetical protein